MRKVAINAMKMFNILKEEGIQPSLVKEDTGSYEDSRIAVLLASFLHDIGMSVGRQNHEISSFVLAERIIDRVLNTVLPKQLLRQITIKSVAMEGIIGHMTHHAISSLEAGIILVADGCDMEKGRSRIPMLINNESRVGDIHKYSSSSVEKVTIEKGSEKPIKISIEMSASVGFFQVEEVLIGKIMASTIKQYIELYANVIGRDIKRYL
jgi:metal-dependent HD superfamily phosphatase/phosphodiesterase